MIPLRICMPYEIYLVRLSFNNSLAILKVLIDFRRWEAVYFERALVCASKIGCAHFDIGHVDYVVHLTSMTTCDEGETCIWHLTLAELICESRSLGHTNCILSSTILKTSK